MATNTINLDLRREDAEPILREAAEEAAKFGSLLDHITRNTYDYPRGHQERFDDARERWRRRYLHGKRIVEAFGLEVEQPGEAETLTIHIPHKVLKSHIVRVAGIAFRSIDKSVPDPKRAMPAYRRGIHEEACRQAAARVVRRLTPRGQHTPPAHHGAECRGWPP